MVFVLTDGSGRTGRSRMDSTLRLLAETGATGYPAFRQVTDQQVYTAFLRQDIPFFLNLRDQLQRLFDELQPATVVGDAMEYYNPTHDLCRILIDSILLRTAASARPVAENFDFTLVGPVSGETPGAINRELPPEIFEKKCAAARNYVELTAEVERQMAQFGPTHFRNESLRPVVAGCFPERSGIPFYEDYGRQQVEKGIYSEAIAFDRHFVPVLQALDLPIPRRVTSGSS
ncbi:MAG: hypothetical protein HQL56_12730 [Magnetococcales bacterium]|nr:hypothetical protein [Magnetococcales bacterium]